MTFRQILEKTLEILGDEEICLDTESPKRKRLIASGNMIYHELTSEYAHLKNKETLLFEGNKLYFSAFSKKVKDILGVYIDSQSIPFKLYPLYIEAEIEGLAEVKYLYHPDEPELDDEIVLPPQFTAFVLANGVASEYFYRSGLTDEAIFYKNRYDTAILNLSRIRKGITIKARRVI